MAVVVAAQVLGIRKGPARLLWENQKADSDLVWAAKGTQSAIAARHEQRVQEATARASRVASQEEYAQELRAMLASTSPAAAGLGPITIEHIPAGAVNAAAPAPRVEEVD